MTKTPEQIASRTRRPKQDTKLRILEHGYEMYVDGRLVPGNERFASVLDELGYTTGAGYQIWTSQAAFRADLRVFVAERIEYTSVSRIAEQLADLEAKGLPLDEFVLTAADLYYRIFLSRDSFYLTLRFFAMSEDREPEITARLVDSYRFGTDAASKLFSRTLDRYGLQVKVPFTVEDIAVAAIALVEGFALRARIEPDRAETKTVHDGTSHYVFSRVFLELVRQYVEPAR